MKPARYIFLNQGLGMSPGKLAAQAAHSETLAVRALWEAQFHEHELCSADRAWLRMQQDLWEIWFGHGHYAKYVMKADDSTMIMTIKYYLEERDFRTYLVIDEGHTEETYMVPTAMAVELVDKEEERTESIFSNFRMYREKSTAAAQNPPSWTHWRPSLLLGRP